VLVESFPVGVLGCNCTIVACDETREAIVVDPGGDPDRILDVVRANRLEVKQVLHTHAHFDHILGTRDVKEGTGAKIRLHPGDDFLYQSLAMQASWLGMRVEKDVLPVDEPLRHQETITFGKTGTLVLHTPGHTPGSCCFSLRTEKGMLLLSGDTLFQSSVGRTDLPGGDQDLLFDSIRRELLPLDDETRVICGHGPETTIGRERRKNPFVRALTA
jgi:glyoxylase-like metal-dependent hydrolase (beta-lactamase superfamily II)